MNYWTYRQTPRKFAAAGVAERAQPVTTCSTVRAMMKESQGCVNQATAHQATEKQALCDAAASLPDLNLERPWFPVRSRRADHHQPDLTAGF